MFGKKQRWCFHSIWNVVNASQGYGFSSGHVWIWELDCEESWLPKNWCFWSVVLKTLESPLEIQPVHLKGDQSWVFIGKTDAEAETPVFWPPHVKSWFIGRPWCLEGLGAGREGDDRGWDGWMASPTRWTWVWVSSRRWWQGGLVCCGSWGCKGSDRTEPLNQTELTEMPLIVLLKIIHFILCDFHLRKPGKKWTCFHQGSSLLEQICFVIIPHALKSLLCIISGTQKLKLLNWNLPPLHIAERISEFTKTMWILWYIHTCSSYSPIIEHLFQQSDLWLFNSITPHWSDLSSFLFLHYYFSFRVVFFLLWKVVVCKTEAKQNKENPQ